MYVRTPTKALLLELAHSASIFACPPLYMYSCSNIVQYSSHFVDDVALHEARQEAKDCVLLYRGGRKKKKKRSPQLFFCLVTYVQV